MNDSTDASPEEAPRRERLSDDDLRSWAADHHPWAVGTGSDRLLREYRFESFGAAMRFMAKVAPVADELDHHPKWENVHDRVTVELSTHDRGGVTELDLELAGAMDRAAHEVEIGK
ncbi:MAG: 4a-hydroxytetrahydrobiopterin dehydratase [Microthrixaceae bacterium]|nr:4a-hydroxytetrahydrobiopterin dehydratase [Microthrixaceae bacterium]